MNHAHDHLPAPPSPIDDRHEAFCQAYLELDNASAAYRRVYDPDGRQPSQQIWSSAARLVAHPDVATRIRQLRDAAAAGAIVRAVDLIAHDFAVMTADPNEISSVVVEACRHCHGDEHRYQWRDEAEYAEAYDTFMRVSADYDALPEKARLKAREPLPPDISGGFGYDPAADTVLDCPHCFGRGVLDVQLHDTRKLSPAARKLFKSAEKDRYGAIKVNVHDQAAAKERLYRALGAFKDGVGVPSVPLPPDGGIKADASDEAATRQYLQMVGR